MLRPRQRMQKDGDASRRLLSVEEFDSSKHLGAGHTLAALIHVRVVPRGARDNLVSFLICDKRFRFFKTIKQLFIVCLNLTRERTVGNPCEIDGQTVNVKEFANGTLGVMLNEFAFEF